MNTDLGVGMFHQHRQPAEVIDVTVRENNPLDVDGCDRLAKFRTDRVQPLQQMLVRLAVSAARIDQSQGAGVEDQVRIGYEAGKGLDWDSVQLGTATGNEAFDGGEFDHVDCNQVGAVAMRPSCSSLIA